MEATDAKFAGSVPELYERYLVPLLFEPYAQDLAQRLSDLPNGTVVEVAAGTGVVTRALRKALPASVQILATDLNEGMLKIAASRSTAHSISFQQADAQHLPFADGFANVIACQFGIMFVPSKAAAYREAMRVLAPGGRLLFNTWDNVARNEVTAVVSRAIQELFPEDPPRFIERTPFGYFDAAAIRAELQAAGFEHIQIETVEKVSQAPSAEYAAIGLCQGTPLRGEIEARGTPGLADATAAARAALQTRYGDGPFENCMSALVVTAYRP